MKVALVAEWLDPWRGGAETSTSQLMHDLVARGVELHVFTRSRPSPIPGLHVHTISGASMSRTRRSITFARRVEGHLRSDSFDLVHAVSPLRIADVYQPRGGTVAETIERNLALLGSTSARRLKRYANRFNLKQRYMLGLERYMLRRPDGPVVVAISDYVVKQLKEHYALPDERIRMIYNGVVPDTTSPDERARHRSAVRAEFDIPPEHILVLFIAHNFRLKGLHRWMEALGLLVQRGVTDVRSLIVGKGESEKWHRLAGRLGVGGHIIFTGPSDRVGQFYHAADLLVHPTYYDPCSRVVLEAMASGLPCITTRWDGSSEMIRDGESGYVLDDPGDVAGLADRVERLRHHERRRMMGQAARKAVESVTTNKHSTGIISLYEEMLVPETLRAQASL